VDLDSLKLLIVLLSVFWWAWFALDDMRARALRQLRQICIDGAEHTASHSDKSRKPSVTPHVGDLNDDLKRRLNDMQLVDGTFDIEQFVASADIFYEHVVSAYAAGDLEPFHGFLSPDVYRTFSESIASRNEKQEQLTLAFVRPGHGIILDAGSYNSVLQVDVGFKSMLFVFTRDKAGKVVDGNLEAAVIVFDNWTFAKDLKAGHPAWQLVATNLPRHYDGDSFGLDRRAAHARSSPGSPPRSGGVKWLRQGESKNGGDDNGRAIS
jgi:predicted lipid-binding transport protein (Tim44 family)